jgi:hypothetical protein
MVLIGALTNNATTRKRKIVLILSFVVKGNCSEQEELRMSFMSPPKEML